MAFNITEFQSELKFGGARSSLFDVSITNPVNGGADDKIRFMCQAAAIPSATLNEVPVSYFGREVKFAGNRTYDNWSVEIINDEDFLIRNALEEWNNVINRFEGNIRDVAAATPQLYKSQAEVTQLSKTGERLRTYKFVGIWPSTIDQIDLSWSDDAIQTFGVSFTYDYWEVSGSTGNAGGN